MTWSFCQVITSCSNRISDNINIIDVVHFYGRDETSADSYEFGLDWYNVNRVDLELFDNRIVRLVWEYHKLYSVISPPILQQFPQS